MKKIKTLLLILIALTWTFTLSGCFFGKQKLANAMEKLSEENYTVETTMRMTMKVTYGGESESQSIKSTTYTESDGRHVYSKTQQEGKTYYTYMEKVSGQYESYVKDGSYWKEVDTEEINNSLTTDEKLFKLDVKEYFKKEDGIWVGDTELITEELEDYLDENFADLIGNYGDKVKLNETKITQYTIELDGKEVSEIVIGMRMEMEIYGYKMVYVILMKMEFSEIGTTEVTIPKNFT